jgi:hypothetical protein
LCAQKSRKQTAFNYVRIVRISQSVQPYFWHNFRGGTVGCTQAVPYGFRTVTSWHKNQGRLLCGFSEKFGTVSKEAVQPLMHPKFDVAVGTNFKASVQPFGGTKIDEQTCNLLQKILKRVLKSFVHFPV